MSDEDQASPPKLRVKDVSVVFPGQQGNEPVVALDQLNLDIAKGELVVALGASGCGKTTLLNLIAGFLKPTSGKILLDNQPVTRPGKDRGVVFQSHALLPWLSVMQNAEFGLRLQGVSKVDRREIASKILSSVGLGDFHDHAVWQLSGGMRQRLGIARVLAADPEIMLMDEPFGALDALTRESMQETLLKLWGSSHKTIFFITHGVEEALFLATRLIVLSPRPGRIIFDERMSFSKEFLTGTAARTLKSRADYIEARETVHSLVRGTEAAHA